MKTDLIKRWGMDDLIVEIHGKVNRKSHNYFKTSKKHPHVFFVCCYDPEKPERKTYRRWKNRDNLRYATQLAKLDFHDYPAERAKYEAAFARQDKYKSLFHYIVACHKLALDRADAMTQKPNGRAMECLQMFFIMHHVGCTNNGHGRVTRVTGTGTVTCSTLIPHPPSLNL